jgi:hypothetical protein
MGYKKGSMSKTHKGDKDFTTKKGDKVFHRSRHFVKKPYQPYSFHKMISGGRRTRRRTRTSSNRNRSRKHR